MLPGPCAMSLRLQDEVAHTEPNSVTEPAGVTRPICGRNSEPSVNQRLPSEPLVMYRGALLAVGIRYCFSDAIGGAAEAAASGSSTDRTTVSGTRREARTDAP